MLFCNARLEIVREYAVFIKPDGWVLSDDAAKVNGLTMERLMAEGTPIAMALDVYEEAVRTNLPLVAFYAQFDCKMMRAELRRAMRDDLFAVTRNLCVMRPCTQVCQIPNLNRGGFKFPKLSEAMEHFGLKQQSAHSALGDAYDARAILAKLLSLGVCPEPSVHQAKAGTEAGQARAARAGGGAVSRPRSTKAAPVSAGDEIPS